MDRTKNNICKLLLVIFVFLSIFSVPGMTLATVYLRRPMQRQVFFISKLITVIPTFLKTEFKKQFQAKRL